MLCLFAACQPGQPSNSQENGKGSKASSAAVDSQTYFPISIGNQPLQLQLALEPAEKQRGLMFRQELAEDQGMLFLFEGSARRGFWMRNTGIPLDIGYFDASGRLLEVHKLFPYDENTVASRSHEVMIAVETNRGWFERNNVSPGARIDMEALKQALNARNWKHPSLHD
ncbi:MAG: DUF192 domain-containing protein [Puniceicoccaceae bacterium]|nr:MAG: DUF192 domain-containing protein [Puniceicoccaceae bacterium]